MPPGGRTSPGGRAQIPRTDHVHCEHRELGSCGDQPGA